MSRRIPSWLKSTAALLLLAAGITRLLVAADLDSQDFQVYWKAVTAWLGGEFPYRILPEDRGFVFKYPPWMIPLFVPFSWLSFGFAKAVWACLELLLLAYCSRALRSQGVSRGTLILSLALFWYLWLAHFYSGQFTLVLLAAALWAGGAVGPSKGSLLRDAVLTTLFTAKVFSAYSLAGIWKRLLRAELLLACAGILALTNGVLLWKAVELHQPPLQSLLDLYRGWVQAAASGGAQLGAEVVRGNGNHGFPAAILRVLDPTAASPGLDASVSLILAGCLGYLWSRLSCSLADPERWAGWLAFGVIVHPLAWHHSFVLAFPLCAWSIQAARESRDRRLLALAVLGACLIALLVPQVVGKAIVYPFELAANKSWGVVLLAWVLLRARRIGGTA